MYCIAESAECNLSVWKDWEHTEPIRQCYLWIYICFREDTRIYDRLDDYHLELVGMPIAIRCPYWSKLSEKWPVLEDALLTWLNRNSGYPWRVQRSLPWRHSNVYSSWADLRSERHVRNPCVYLHNRNYLGIMKVPNLCSVVVAETQMLQTNLDRTNINRTVNKIIPYFEVRMLLQKFSWYSGEACWWIANNGFIVQTFRSLRVQNKDRGFSSWSRYQWINTSGWDLICGNTLSDALPHSLWPPSSW